MINTIKKLVCFSFCFSFFSCSMESGEHPIHSEVQVVPFRDWVRDWFSHNNYFRDREGCDFEVKYKCTGTDLNGRALSVTFDSEGFVETEGKIKISGENAFVINGKSHKINGGGCYNTTRYNPKWGFRIEDGSVDSLLYPGHKAIYYAFIWRSGHATVRETTEIPKNMRNRNRPWQRFSDDKIVNNFTCVSLKK